MPRDTHHPSEIKPQGDRAANLGMKAWVIVLILAALALLFGVFLLVGSS